MYRGHVYVPKDPQLHHDIVHAHHDSMMTGHPGQWKTLELVSCNYWWLGISCYVSGRIQDWECMRCLGTCRALMYLQGVTQGEWVPAECLSRSEKKAAFSFYSSPALYNGQVTWRKELNKKAVTHY